MCEGLSGRLPRGRCTLLTAAAAQDAAVRKRIVERAQRELSEVQPFIGLRIDNAPGACAPLRQRAGGSPHARVHAAAGQRGCIVRRVLADTPAEQAGMQVRGGRGRGGCVARCIAVRCAGRTGG